MIKPVARKATSRARVEEDLSANYAVVINERFGYFETVFEANVSREALSETIERELKAFGALYPLTYAHDLPVFLDDEDQVTFRIDTENENNSHVITVAKLG